MNNERFRKEAEEAARHRKARKLASWLVHGGVTAEQVAAFTDEQWAVASAAAAVHAPSQETKAVVLSMLGEVKP